VTIAGMFERDDELRDAWHPAEAARLLGGVRS
jgi:hypothetical protein